MEPLRRAMESISAGLARLNATQKLLIGAVVVILAMMLFLVQLYTGQNALVQLLPGQSVEDQQRAIRFLQTSGATFEPRDDGVYVSPAQRSIVLAQMAEGNAMPSDSRVLFDNLIDKQSWTLSQKQNQQLEVIAVQNELSAIISKMSGIRSASVILNLPEKRGMGQPSAQPSASATVFPTRSLDQNTVDSIAHLVAGSRGIDPRNVRVIDGSTNRQLRAREEGTMAASTYLEYVTAIESRKQSQLHEMLSAYIPGVIVTVHAQVDATRRRTETKTVLPEGKGSATLLSGETNTTLETHEPVAGGEPGPRSNTREDITGLGAQGASTRETTSEAKFSTEFGRETKVVDDARGYPTKVNAVVNIPRTYFVDVWRSQKTPAGAAPAPAANTPAEPSETDLQPVVDGETSRIKKEVELQIDTSAGVDTVKGEVHVSMIPVVPGLAPGAGAAQPASLLGIPTGALAMDGVVKTVSLGGLAVVALGMVVVTAMRASRRETLPSPSELVGVPPALDSSGDLIGEASEADSALQGIELTDDELRTRKVTEQVSDLIRERPQDAARVIGRWVAGS